jgi:hypothetical protein
MAFVVLKTNNGGINGVKQTILINDPEGLPYEFDTYEEAKKIADLFQKNTTHNSVYTIKEIKEIG